MGELYTKIFLHINHVANCEFAVNVIEFKRAFVCFQPDYDDQMVEDQEPRIKPFFSSSRNSKDKKEAKDRKYGMCNPYNW